MAGLESIALAVAHLERVREQGDQLDTATEFANQGSPPPFASTFGGAPRMVSVEYDNTASFPIDSQHHQRVEAVPKKRSYNRSLPKVAFPSVDTDMDPEGKDVATGEVATLLMRIQNISHELDMFFFYMEQLQKIALEGETKPRDIPSPDEAITQVERSDVLLGRGGETNHHSGNIQYRQLVKVCQGAYLAAKRCDKPRIAVAIVEVVRSRDGRFLKKDENTKNENTWKDVGNTRAREKTSQALREGAPELRGTIKEGAQTAMLPALTHPHAHTSSLIQGQVPLSIPYFYPGMDHHPHPPPTVAGGHVYHIPAESASSHVLDGYKRIAYTAAQHPMATTSESSPQVSPAQKKYCVAEPKAAVTADHTFSLVAATISAEDSEGERSLGSKSSASSLLAPLWTRPAVGGGGPRIKQLLKKRMIQDSSNQDA